MPLPVHLERNQYYNKMEYSGCSYEGGKSTEGRMDDKKGVYTYPDGSKFVGELKNGCFHGPGKLYLDGGLFDGVWDKGRVVSGGYVFDDNLEYKEKDWEYCDGETDRRFATEIQAGALNAACGGVFRNKPAPGEPLKDGCYDAGDGYFNSRDGGVYKYEDDSYIREADAEEKKFLIEKAASSFNTAKGVVDSDTM